MIKAYNISMEKIIPLKESTVDAALRYLSTCPYNQVADIIGNIVREMPQIEPKVTEGAGKVEAV